MAKNTSPKSDDDLLNRREESEKDLSLDIQRAQERVLALRREMEEAERREKELEVLRQRKAEVSTGQRAAYERLSRALTLLERSEHLTRRQLEHIGSARETFREQLQQIESIDIDSWSPEEIDQNLSRALTILEHSDTIYTQFSAKVDALSNTDSATPDDVSLDEGSSLPLGAQGNFFELVRKGFAFTLPLLIVLSLLVLVLFLKAEGIRP